MARKLRIILKGKYSSDIKPYLEKNSAIRLVHDNPDFVLVYGGDGALLGAEKKYPGIPKFPVRDSRTAPLCSEHCSYEKLFHAFDKNLLKKSFLIKLEGVSGGRKVIGINDVFIHNSNPVSAIRYKVWIDGQPYGEEIVGDGVGVSTVHGSTAYYRSITHSVFRIGIGLAFSNSTEVTNHLVIPEDSIIRILITRGPAVLTADNSGSTIKLNSGDNVIISKIDKHAIVYGLDIFMCPKCRKLRHPRD